MTSEAIRVLPECFRAIVEIDRAMKAKVVPLSLARDRRYHRRMAEVSCLPAGGANSAALR